MVETYRMTPNYQLTTRFTNYRNSTNQRPGVNSGVIL
jgi:hypothetical protein